MDVSIQPMIPGDKGLLVGMTEKTGFFRSDEIAVADEVLTDCAHKGDLSGYFTAVARIDFQPVGYVTYGPVPLTVASWDIYWVAVDPACQGKGIGKALMQEAERAIRAQNGRLMLAETSSRDLYEPTRQFYQAVGFRAVAEIQDYYDIGDALVIFGKSLRGGELMLP